MLQSLDALTKLANVPDHSFLSGLKDAGLASQYDTQSYLELMQKNAQDAQMNPLRVQAQQIENDQGLQNLAKSTRENKEADYTSEAKMQSQLQKHLQTASDADVHMAYNKFRMMAADPNPKTRALGIAGLQTTDEFLKEKERTRSHLAGIAEQMRGQKETEQMRIDAGKYDKRAVLSVEMQLLKAKNPVEKAEILEQAAAQAHAMGDDEHAQVYIVRAQEARQRAAEDAQNRKVDPNGIAVPSVANLPSNPPATATAPIGGQGNAPAQQTDRVNVIAPDGRRGSIPRSQLQDALGAGYKEVK